MNPEQVPASVATNAKVVDTAGPILFSRYAYPPNELGYCGPPDHRALLDYGASGTVDAGLAQLARGFAGAWPYLELISNASGIGDPLDRRVVEAYWVGNQLLERIDQKTFGSSLSDRFKRRTGSDWGFLAEAIPEGACPHHNYHVFGVYPWVGLLWHDRSQHPLYVLDRCRIRWGVVESVAGDNVAVKSRPLEWDGRQLSLGADRVETARVAVGGVGFLSDLQPGDTISLHWDWVCDRLTKRQLAALKHYTARQLEITNRQVAHPAPMAILDSS